MISSVGWNRTMPQGSRSNNGGAGGRLSSRLGRSSGPNFHGHSHHGVSFAGGITRGASAVLPDIQGADPSETPCTTGDIVTSFIAPERLQAGENCVNAKGSGALESKPAKVSPGRPCYGAASGKSVLNLALDVRQADLHAL